MNGPLIALVFLIVTGRLIYSGRETEVQAKQRKTSDMVKQDGALYQVRNKLFKESPWR